MIWFKNLKIRSKLLFSFMVILIIAVSVNLYGLIKLRSIEKSYKNTINLTEERFGHIFEIQNNFSKIRFIECEIYYPENTMENLNGFYTEIEKEFENIKAELNKLHIVAEEGIKNNIDEILPMLEKYRFEIIKIIDWLRKTEDINIDNPYYREALIWAQDQFSEISEKFGDVLYYDIGKLSETALGVLKALGEINAVEADISQMIILTVLSVMSFIIFTGSFYVSKIIGNQLIYATNLLHHVSENINCAAGQLSLASISLAESSSEQAASIEETSATMNETSAMVANNVENTKTAKNLMEKSAILLDETIMHAKDLIEGMNELTMSSNEIEKIVSEISDIASQTNILALNAAVEAIRAGEIGKSFSAVAEEVRNLALKSAVSSNDTAYIIKKNRDCTKISLCHSDNVNTALINVREAEQNIIMLLNEISIASEEQSQGVKQINIALAQIEKATQSNAAISEQSASSANELKNQTDDLMQVYDNIKKLVFGSR